MPVSVRTRFEVLKRDHFTCKYCGQSSPEVVLEVDHIVPTCEGGSDDEVNLVTACYSCNRGKSGIPLHEVMTGEDPHDRAVMVLERERQLREHNHVLFEERARRENEANELVEWWSTHGGDSRGVYRRDFAWLMQELKRTPAESIREAMEVAILQRATKDLRYAAGVLRNWREE